jgi:hypothetical protein
MCHQITDATVDRFSISSIQLADLGRNFPTSWLLTWRSALDPPWRPVPIQSRCNRFDACFVVAILHQDGQSDPRQLIGERYRQNVAMHSPRRCRVAMVRSCALPSSADEAEWHGRPG